MISKSKRSIYYDINKAYVDNVSLRLTQAQTYAYDAEGNVDTAALTGGGAEGAEYDDDTGDLTQYTAPNGIVFNYTSNGQHSIVREEGAGTVTEYTYEQGGGGYLTSTKLSAASPEDSTAEADPRYLYTNSQFTEDKNRTDSVKDGSDLDKGGI